MTGRVSVYLAVAFAFSWAIGALNLLMPTEGIAAQIASTLVGVVFMFGPLVGAVVAQKAAGQAVLAPLGFRWKVNRWWLVAWLGPFAYAFLALFAALPLPGVEWSADLSGFFERLSTMLPPDQIEQSRAEMESVPPVVFWLMMIVQPLVAGVTINAVAAFGEELGWRGFLFRAWGHLGFWRASLLIGAVWGLWHAPLIAQGHNYPQHPWLGVGLMVVWCTLLSPPFQYIRLRTGSVVAASVMHGTLNASAGIALMFLRGGGDLLVGVTGLAGMLALVAINAALFVFGRPEQTRDDV
jgi:membrane protease YdiL (CAAX protease family)